MSGIHQNEKIKEPYEGQTTTNWLAAIVESSDDAIISKTLDGIITSWNPGAEKIFGYTAKEVVGQPMLMIFPPDRVHEEPEILERIQRGERVEHFETVRVAKSGKLIDVSASISPIRDETGKIIGASKIARDITRQKQAETVSRRLAAIVEFSDDAIIGKDLNGVIATWNKGAEKIFGYTASEMIGTSIMRLIPAERQDEENQILGKIKRGESVEHFETQRQTKDGRLIDASVTASPIKDASGKIIGVSKIARDIMAKKAQEREIARLNRLYAALSQVNQAIVMTQERDELFAKVCRVLVEFGGFRMAWVGWLDAETRKIIPVAQHGDGLDYLSQIAFYAEGNPERQGPCGIAINDEKTYICNDFARDPYTVQRRKAAERSGFLAAAVLPVRLHGEVCGVISVYAGEIGFFQDKEIRLLEEAAGDVSFALDNFEREKSRRLLESAVDQSKESIVITDAELNLPGPKIVFVNPAFTQMTGYTAEEVIGKTPRILQGPRTDKAVLRRLRKNLERGEAFEGEAINYRKDGKEFDLEWQIAPLRNDSGKITHFVATQHDITDRKKLEAQFRQSQKMEGIGQLAGGVAHDFNNILAVIEMQSGLLKSSGGLSAEQSEFTDEISVTVQRAAALTRQLLLFSRREVFQPRDMDLSESITSTAKMLRRILGENVEMQLKLASQPMFIHADAGMMDQVLMNLAVNARDAMPNGGQLIIETSGVEFDEFAASQSAQVRVGSFVRLSISDSGCGIPPENLSKIFEPFFTTKDVGKGTGLGLATVFGIVQQHQGWINVYSEVNHGTTFRVYLPRLAKNGGQKSAQPAPVEMRGGNEAILLAEDDPSLRVSVRKALSQLGYRILEAPTGVKALEVWKENRDEIRLLLTDLVMPDGMTGKDLAQRILQENPKLKVIYMSGYSAEVVSKDFPLKEGVNFLTKPFQATKLAQTIRESLDAKT